MASSDDLSSPASGNAKKNNVRTREGEEIQVFNPVNPPDGIQISTPTSRLLTIPVQVTVKPEDVPG
ncbi:hypothetical protein ACW7EJ_01140, partial [Acinetobacter soli]